MPLTLMLKPPAIGRLAKSGKVKGSIDPVKITFVKPMFWSVTEACENAGAVNCSSGKRNSRSTLGNKLKASPGRQSNQLKLVSASRKAIGFNEKTPKSTAGISNPTTDPA